MKEVHLKDNAAVVAILFLYQFGLLLPFTILLESQVAIVGFTFLLLAYSFISKEININSKTIFLFIIPLLLLLLKLPFEQYFDTVGSNVGLDMLISFLTIGLSGILLGTLRFSNERFLHYGYVFAWVNFLAVFAVPFLKFYGNDINYMRFGYSLLPTVFFSFVFVFYSEKRVGALLLFVASFVELFIFGARGALLTFLLFAVIYVFFISDIKIGFKTLIAILITLFGIFLPDILNFVVEILDKFGLYSYSITKYLNFFQGENFLSTTSDRDILFEAAYPRLLQSPFWGLPMNTCFLDTGASYYHNIVIDIIINFGLIVFIFFVLFLLTYIFKAIASKDRDFKIVFFIIFLVPMGRLVVSSSFWQRPDFWFFMSFCVNYMYKNRSNKTRHTSL